MSGELLPLVKSGELLGFGAVWHGDGDGLHGGEEFEEKSGGDVGR